MKWCYENGLVLQSIFLAGSKSGNEELCDYVKSMYDAVITGEGKIVHYAEDEYNLDQINAGKTLFLLHHKYQGSQYPAAIKILRKQLDNHPRTKSGGFWHKKIYPWQMWLDGLYMQAPFYAQYANEFENEKKADLFNDIVHQFTLVESKARDADTGLLYHAWDESCQQKWANPETGCSPHFWGRAMGWYCMALVDVMENIPSAYSENHEALKAIALRLIAPLLQYQDENTGLWYQVLNMGTEAKNYLESSASSMFVYFLLKMLRLKLVAESDAAAVKKAAVKAYEGLVKNKIEKTEGGIDLNGICKVAGLGGNPYRDGSYAYYVSEPVVAGDFKGVGPFILASLEYEGLNT